MRKWGRVSKNGLHSISWMTYYAYASRWWKNIAWSNRECNLCSRPVMHGRHPVTKQISPTPPSLPEHSGGPAQYVNVRHPPPQLHDTPPGYDVPCRVQLTSFFLVGAGQPVNQSIPRSLLNSWIKGQLVLCIAKSKDELLHITHGRFDKLARSLPPRVLPISRQDDGKMFSQYISQPSLMGWENYQLRASYYSWKSLSKERQHLVLAPISRS